MNKFLSEERKEAVKLLFDAFKHLTTLCTAAIVLLATFLRDLPDIGCSKFFAVGAVIFLLISVLLSVIVLILIPKVLAEDGLRDERVKKPFMGTAFFGGICFILGILSLGLFVVSNLGGF